MTCTRAERPFNIGAWVVLPDHMPWVMAYDRATMTFPIALRQAKADGVAFIRTKGERGIWQRCFWEHTIRDEGDYARPMDYVHFDPVKHGYVPVVGSIRPFVGGRRQVPIHAIGVARVRWTLPPAGVDDNLVTCHSTRAHLMLERVGYDA